MYDTDGTAMAYAYGKGDSDIFAMRDDNTIEKKNVEVVSFTCRTQALFYIKIT